MLLMEVKEAKNKSESDPGYYIKAIEGGENITITID